MIKQVLIKAVNKQELTKDEMQNAMNAIMSGEVSEIEMSAFLTALKMKGETVEEISSAAKVMREKAQSVELDEYYTLDTCGTGGDTQGTYNISTAVAFVAAAAGIKVVKHGNRSITSKCGSADVLEALEINIQQSPEQVKNCVLKASIGFMFAPNHHKAMKYVMGVRRALGFRTVFNILGPLSNPASAKAQVLGVFDRKLIIPMAEVLKNLGVERALVVHSADGLDEISVSDKTYVAELKDGDISTYEIAPEEYGIKRSKLSDIKGGDADVNADIIKKLLSGAEKGAKRDVLVLNAGAALYVGKKVNSIKEGVILAGEILDSGKAIDVVSKLAEMTK